MKKLITIFSTATLILFAGLLFPVSSIAQYSNLLNLDGAGNGSYPRGAFISDGTFLFGTTFGGGTNGMGTVFKIKPDGTGYLKLLEFTGANGQQPNNALVRIGTILYGMTKIGGTNNMGTLFKINDDGTGYTKLLDFLGTTNGSYPSGALINEGLFLYGMTNVGGVNNKGTIFKIMTDGTGYVKLLDFDDTNNGSIANGHLVSDGTYLYGMTMAGGASTYGTIFKIKLDGTGYTKLHDFNSANGKSPLGSLISDGTYLYGTTNEGGNNFMYGTVFKIKTDGTGFATLIHFDSMNGSNPMGDMSSDGTYLYGMTHNGGTGNSGLLFKVKLDGSGYEKLLDFVAATNGSHPEGSVFYDSGALYGATADGGANTFGTIFKFVLPATSTPGEFMVQGNGNSGAVYPNPSSGILNIQCSNSSITMNKIEIFDTLGKMIFESDISQTKSINLTGNAKGIYFARITRGEKISFEKIVLQ